MNIFTLWCGNGHFFTLECNQSRKFPFGQLFKIKTTPTHNTCNKIKWKLKWRGVVLHRLCDLCKREFYSCPPHTPHTTHTHTHIQLLSFFLFLSFYLILPAEFNLLPRVPSHNFFKSTFYETAIPFHRGALYSKSYLQSVICGHINMTKVPVCSHVLCACPYYHLLKHFIGYRSTNSCLSGKL